MAKAQPLRKSEFVTLMALLTSLPALSIDSMLPAMQQIGTDFKVISPAEIQLVVAAQFFGFGFGQLILGPLSDVFGRKPPIYAGLGIFILGSIMSGAALNYDVFILGRFLQGFGGAAPRIIALALIRDQFSGNAMAQITSLVMTIFILVPALAPTLGQGVLLFSGWRAIFFVLFLVGVITWIWFGLRQPETLAKKARKRLTIRQFASGVYETFSQKTTVSCMIVSGLVFGIFIGYLGAVQEIFAKLFNKGDQFPLYFGILALSIGSASFFNSRLVMALGMRRLILIALLWMSVLSNLFVLYLTQFQQGIPPFWLFMAYMMLNFFSVGFLFGNLNALAMVPLGHIAGLGSAILGFVQSTISVIIGISLGRFFHDGIVPLVVSFSTVGLICIFIFFLTGQFEETLRRQTR